MPNLSGTSVRTQQAGQNRRDMQSLAGTSVRTQQAGRDQLLNRPVTRQSSFVSKEIRDFLLNSDLGSVEPKLVNGLQFNQQGDLLEGQLINPNAQQLNEYLKDTMFGQYGIFFGNNLKHLLKIYAIQHNMFKHATVNQNKPPQEWDFNKLGVTNRFLQTFRKYIPAGKEYDISFHNFNGFSLKDLFNNIKDDKKSRFPINYTHTKNDYIKTVAEPIHNAYDANKSNLSKYLKSIKYTRYI